jgi:hypothetical protein
MVTKGPKSIRNIPGEVMSHEENASKWNQVFLPLRRGLLCLHYPFAGLGNTISGSRAGVPWDLCVELEGWHPNQLPNGLEAAFLLQPVWSW